MYAADVDGDGDLDVLGAGQGAKDITWWENTNGAGTSWTEHTVDGNFDQAWYVFAADVDGDGDLDVLGAAYWDDDITWWENRGGQFKLPTTDTAPATITEGNTDDMLKIVATHNGRTGDTDIELVTLQLLFEENAGDSLSSAEANALIENLRIYLDNGNGTFESGSDTPVITVATLSLISGVQTVPFSDGDTDVRVVYGTPRTYFVVVELTSNASSQTPNQFRITHITESSSTAEDRANDIPLALEYAANTASGTTTAQSSQVTLTASSTSGGSVTTPGEGSFQYQRDTVASIIATPSANYHFVNWTGTGVTAGKVADPNSASTTITMDADYTVQANFAIDQRTLTASSTSGGSVTTPGEGSFQYNHGTVASIVATASVNYHFVNWTGTGVTAGKVADPNSASTTITMDADYTVHANFAIDQRTLTTSSTTGGSVTTPGEGSFQYNHGTVASIVATPAANYHFVNWTGSGVTAGKVADPNSASTTITMDANYTVQANFAIDQRTLTTSSTSGGSVTTPGEGSFDYDHGTAAAIVATPDANYHFVNWTGTGVTAGKVADASSASTTITMDADYTAVANFAIDQRTLTTSSTACGSVTTPGEGSFD